MAFNTGNPLGSTDPRDFSDNSENLDRAVNNAASATWTDRFGKSRTTLAGQIGYIGTGSGGSIESYSAGLVLSTYSTIILYNNEFYRPSASATLPYTTTATTPDVDSNLASVGDAVLRQDLAGNLSDGEGAALVNGATIYEGSVAELEALSLAVGTNVYLTEEARAGEFVVKTGTPPSDPQKGIYIVLSNGNYAMRRFDNLTGEGGFSVDWFGVDGTRAGDSTAIRAALDFADGSPVYLAYKRYFYDGTTITNPSIRIYGAAMPQVNAGRTALENGSIIDGTLGFTSSDVDLRNFGVDVGSASAATEGDAIRGTAPINAGGHLHTENLVGLCKNSASLFHALLFQSYQKHTGGNLLGVYGYFGFVTKSQNVDLGLVHTIENDESGVLLKSDTGFGRCRDVSIQRVKCDGGASQKRGFHVQSSDDNLRDVQVGMIEVEGCDENVLLQVGSGGLELRNIDITSIRSKSARDDDFKIDNLNGAASIFNVHVGTLSTENTVTRGIRVQGLGDTEDINIESAFISYEAAAVQATMDGAAFIGANCTRSRIDNLVIIRNFNLSDLIGGITYNSNRENHILGAHIATVYGAERPRPGFSSEALSGTGNTLTIPVNRAGDAYSLTNVAPTTTGVEVNSFDTPVVGAEDFAVGHRYTVYNSSANDMTVVHNPAGGIYNKGAVNKTLPTLEAVSWVYTGAGTWRED